MWEIETPNCFYEVTIKPLQSYLGLFNFNLSQQEQGLKEDLVEQTGPKSRQEQRKKCHLFPPA